jgi:alginate O-acetyltransferase complex protein AlgI
MIFNTTWFLIFFLLFYFGLWIIFSDRIRFYYVLLCSAIFQYHFAGTAGVIPILVMAVCTFFLAQKIADSADKSKQKRNYLIVALSIPVLGLLYYKYQGMLLLSLSSMLSAESAQWIKMHTVQPALPLAISFFTFEFVHYLTDVYHGSQPIKNPFKFGMFCIFFPAVVSGPIKRFQPFLAQMEQGMARPRFEQLVMGLGQILLGFFKKLVIADNATQMIQLMEKSTELEFRSMCLLLFLLSVRILFDFSGYSDIAIGLGRMIGVNLPVNFNFPYWSKNISEFWRRWHISLSSWIRDYIYIPLGGNRHGVLRKFGNLTITMFVCGLWHGASWNFGWWGIYHGLGLAIHNIWERSSWGQRWAEQKASPWVGLVLTNIFVAYGWLLFFYPMDQVFKFTKYLFKMG